MVAMDADEAPHDPTRTVLPDLRILSHIFTGLTDGYFRSDLPLCSMVHRLALSHLLLLHCRNQLCQQFMNASLYSHLQRTFQSVVHSISWLQQHYPNGKFYMCLLGCQVVEEVFCLLRMMEHNKNFDILQPQDRLRSLRAIQSVFEDHVNWKRHKKRYASDRLRPHSYTEDIHVKSVNLVRIWRAAIADAETLLNEHQLLKDKCTGIFDELFSRGVTLLKPQGVSLHSAIEAEDDPSMLQEDPPSSGFPGAENCGGDPIFELFLSVGGGMDKSAAYLHCRGDRVVHVAQRVNELFNKSIEMLSGDRLRRVQRQSKVSGQLTKLDDDGGIMYGSPFLALCAFKEGNSRITSAAAFSFVQCMQHGKVVVGPKISWLQEIDGVSVVGEYLPFKASNGENLEWTGRWGKTLQFPSHHICFVNMNINPNGRWQLAMKEVNVFINSTPGIENRPQLQGTPYTGVEHTSLRPSPEMKNCLFCDAVVSIKKMLDYVAAHLERGDPMPNANKDEDHEACGFCGQTDGQCKTELAGKTVKSTCPYASRLHYSTAPEEFRNMPRQCPVPGCMATRFTLNIRKHFERSHPRTNIGGHDIS